MRILWYFLFFIFSNVFLIFLYFCFYLRFDCMEAVFFNFFLLCLCMFVIVLFACCYCCCTLNVFSFFIILKVIRFSNNNILCKHKRVIKKICVVSANTQEYFSTGKKTDRRVRGCGRECKESEC